MVLHQSCVILREILNLHWISHILKIPPLAANENMSAGTINLYIGRVSEVGGNQTEPPGQWKGQSELDDSINLRFRASA